MADDEYDFGDDEPFPEDDGEYPDFDDEDFGDYPDMDAFEDIDYPDFGVGDFVEDGELNDLEDGEDGAWRFDDTRLDELEQFLQQVEIDTAPTPRGTIPTPPPMSAGILQLIRDVNNELAEAQREVLVLRDENGNLRGTLDRLENSNGTDEELADLHDAAACAEDKTAEAIALVEEQKREFYELKRATMSVSDRFKRSKSGPAKRGVLGMGNKKLDCELIGGQSLELSDRSQDGHVHVSKIKLSHVLSVKMVESAAKNSFGVTTAGGTYIMTAGNESEAKSWVRAIQVSIKVAKQKAMERNRDTVFFIEEIVGACHYAGQKKSMKVAVVRRGCRRDRFDHDDGVTWEPEKSFMMGGKYCEAQAQKELKRFKEFLAKTSVGKKKGWPFRPVSGGGVDLEVVSKPGYEFLGAERDNEAPR